MLSYEVKEKPRLTDGVFLGNGDFSADVSWPLLAGKVGLELLLRHVTGKLHLRLATLLNE